MKLSIAICTHNEGYYVQDLLKSLVRFKCENQGLHEYEIVIVDDFSNDHITNEAFSHHHEHINFFLHECGGDFATHKNFLNSVCSGDWILNLDADETLPLDFLDNLPLYIESNPALDSFWLPRVNTVDGLTLPHVQKWGWVLTTLPGYTKAKIITNSAEYELLKQYDFILSEENGFITYNQPIIQWPDMQMRLYRRSPDIRWEGKVHERLVGYKDYSAFPVVPEFAIQHHKDIERQTSQNTLYDKITKLNT